MTTTGAFDSAKDSITLRPLVRSSKTAVTVNAILAGDHNQDPRRLMVEATKTPRAPILAARLSGTLDSAYPGGFALEKKQPDEAKGKDEARSTLIRSAKPANVILVGDADMLMDRNWIQMQSLAGKQVAKVLANNGDFVVNAIEQMSGGTVLSDLRGRGVSWRPFEFIQQMQARSDSRFRAKERELTVQLLETEDKLKKLPKAPEGSNRAAAEERARTIDGFRSRMMAIRSALRDVQFALRRDVDDVKNVVTVLNVGVVPGTIGLIALALVLRRPRRAVPKKIKS
jgi:ABC-type uncharacterized transport system involved in gliding motility auxiliary subunit